ncbi:Uncharacterised protein [Metamycoplasma arthritidis]|uniref:Uncharacterized protein n=1 Tax=Metamycoplasma arthritidis (strain 158L3-1) TaxID=243272 RepID=B3PLT6_META1|nr:hypothetical protein [Metamycoplasma arthritidis]ACF06988.1 hypothetical protein MARTH_orf022 [Metamycoplasma arthritidis 158L3-1]VEU78517.1 Uncharacterised protein [Metamycoplasma arthritidis]
MRKDVRARNKKRAEERKLKLAKERARDLRRAERAAAAASK